MKLNDQRMGMTVEGRGEEKNILHTYNLTFSIPGAVGLMQIVNAAALDCH